MQTGFAFIEATDKVKAHQALENLEGEEKRKARANHAADLHAKAALSAHPAPETAIERETLERWRLAAEIALAIAKIGTLCPRQKREGREERLLTAKLFPHQCRHLCSRQGAPTGKHGGLGGEGGVAPGA